LRVVEAVVGLKQMRLLGPVLEQVGIEHRQEPRVVVQPLKLR